MTSPLPFFPETSWIYAQEILLKGSLPEHALTKARESWQGGDFRRGECEEEYMQRCFGDTDPIGPEFQRLAEEVFGPLLHNWGATPTHDQRSDTSSWEQREGPPFRTLRSASWIVLTFSKCPLSGSFMVFGNMVIRSFWPLPSLTMCHVMIRVIERRKIFIMPIIARFYGILIKMYAYAFGS